MTHSSQEYNAHLGQKPCNSKAQLADVVASLDRGEAVAAIAKSTGLTRQTINRIRYSRAETEAARTRRSKAT